MITTQSITKISHLVDHLTLTYKNSWFQEDISLLTELFFSTLPAIKIQEKIIGADRENIRFSWQGHYFVLNFDCCSQSCWLEGQDNESTQQLSNLYTALIQ